MSQSVNMILTGIDSCHDFQKRLLKEVDSKVSIQSCLVILKNSDHTDVFDDDRIETIDYDLINQNRYREKYDMNQLLPLSRQILDDMAPFFETSLHSLLRNTDQEVYTFDEAKKYYLDHLRFWNHQFVTRKINYVLITTPPHQAHNYIIYALAKIYHIKVQFLLKSSLVGRNFVLEDLYAEPQTLIERYHELCSEKAEVTLSPDIEQYYQTMLKRSEMKEVAIVNSGQSKKQIANHILEKYNSYFAGKTRRKRKISHYKQMVKGLLKNSRKKLCITESVCNTRNCFINVLLVKKANIEELNIMNH